MARRPQPRYLVLILALAGLAVVGWLLWRKYQQPRPAPAGTATDLAEALAEPIRLPDLAPIELAPEPPAPPPPPPPAPPPQSVFPRAFGGGRGRLNVP